MVLGIENEGKVDGFEVGLGGGFGVEGKGDGRLKDSGDCGGFGGLKMGF